MKTLGFIGGGRITRILLNGFKNANIHFKSINVFDIDENVLNKLRTDYPQITISNNEPEKAASSDWMFIALHPPVLMKELETIKSFIKKDAMIVSLAPKITFEKIQSILTDCPNLARLNPNAGTYVNQGFNPVCFAENTDKKMIKEFLGVFEELGNIPVVQEDQIEAYAMVSAMGHTYFWYQLQQLKELGMSFGLSENEAKEAISVMLWGTTETLFNSGLSYHEVTDLIPVKPMAEHENTIIDLYKNCLNGLYQKIKPQQ